MTAPQAPPQRPVDAVGRRLRCCRIRLVARWTSFVTPAFAFLFMLISKKDLFLSEWKESLRGFKISSRKAESLCLAPPRGIPKP